MVSDGVFLRELVASRSTMKEWLYEATQSERKQ